MKIRVPIEVSGITDIVIKKANVTEHWERCGCAWIKKSETMKEVLKSDHRMMLYKDQLLRGGKYRAWVSGATLNIRRDYTPAEEFDAPRMVSVMMGALGFRT